MEFFIVTAENTSNLTIVNFVMPAWKENQRREVIHVLSSVVFPSYIYIMKLKQKTVAGYGNIAANNDGRDVSES
jgi:hypothetical protein